MYDWLHLHHEDFTGQYGKFYSAFKNASWYIQQKKEFERDARKLGYSKVSELKLDVAKKIKDYIFLEDFYLRCVQQLIVMILPYPLKI